MFDLKEKPKRKKKISNSNLTTERNITDIPKARSDHPQDSLPCCKKNLKFILILSILGIILLAGIIAIIFLIPKKRKDESKIKSSENIPPGLDIKTAKEVFSPSFKIASKERTLTQISQKSFLTYETIEEGLKSSYTILNKALYDIYTINSTSASDLEKNFYTNIYTTVITVNSLCSKVSTDPENDDCQLEKNLDLNKRELNNLRRNEEDDEKLIRKAILPICIVEHTDTNLIISFTCPETLTESYKADILRAFTSIKPDSIKGFELDKEYGDTQKEEKNDKIYIKSFDNVCVSPNFDPTKTVICNATKDIITDKEGILISIKTTNSTKTIKDEENSYSSIFTYEFKNIPKEHSDSFNEKIYRQNLDSIFSITKSFMNKETYINNFTNYVIDLLKDTEETTTEINLRELKEEEDNKHKGVYEEKIFEKNILNISMELSLKNDIGLSEGQTAKAISYHEVNDEDYNEISRNLIQTNLNKTLDEFISISKSGNKLANNLYEDLNEPLLNFMSVIKENIEQINECLASKDLSEIFDSTLAINQLNLLPYDFISATENLYNGMNNFANNILYIIDDAKKKLKENISSFLTNSHNLMFKLFEQLTDLSNALSTDKSKIVGISTYYLNNTDSSYNDIIQKAKYILDNYYQKEKDLIYPMVDTNLKKFYKNTKESMEKYQSMLDNISDRLSNGNLTISLANTEDYQKAIRNIYNTKIKANEIIETVKNKFEECIKPNSNGYFESQKDIDEYNKSYGKIGENAIKISYALDNNELIDKTFDDVMTSFRDKFIELLGNMEISVKEKFPLEENVLSTSLFNKTFLNEIDEYFKNEIINILNLIKKENDEYLKSINEIMSSFKSENGKSLEQIMADLINEMTDINLDNLNRAFNNSLTHTFKIINEIIENNKNLGIQYLINVKKANSYHITQGFKNKYNEFNSSIQNIKEYINKNLKIILSNKYKNIISQIRLILQSIKSNEILKKYSKNLPSAENHLNYINYLFETFNRHISDNTFNIKFLPLINNFIEISNNILDPITSNFSDIYNEIVKKDFYNILNDYDIQRVETERYRCGVIRRCTRTLIYYDGYNVEGTDNYLNLTSINIDEYMKEFVDKYNELYPNFSRNVQLYNSLLSKLDIEIINETKKEKFKEKIIYLENISDKVNSIINEKLGNNLLMASYNYFKNKINNTLQTELDNIIEDWKNAFDEVYNNIDSNKEKFKSQVNEFFYLGSFYYQTYCQNISYSYSESIVEKLKNDFNYTNRYYYNIIISKLNKTYFYILSNMPTNEAPFDEIINKRIEEIKSSYNEILIKLKDSRKGILDKEKQEITLKVNFKNFFHVNDVINNHIKTFNSTINEKNVKLYLLASQIYKEKPEELVAAKFYLENSINGKQIKDNYDMINKVNFIDLQTDVYQKLIDDVWKLDRDELYKNIMNSLNKLNKINNDSFKYEKEKYIELLKNKLYGEFSPREELISKISTYFSNGINNCNENSTQEIKALINLVIDKVTNHLSNEAERLNNELTSYSNDFTDIENKLNTIKKEIYEHFYSAIISVVHAFYEQILKKFYKNFIEVGLNEYEKNINSTDFGKAQFLNMTINLNEIIYKEFNSLITDYRNLTFNQIQFLYQKYNQTLNQIFNFSKIKLEINNAIDNMYNSKLLPALEKIGIHKSGNEGVSNYDLPKNIMKDINDFMDEQVSKTKSIIKEMEGDEFLIDDIPPKDFSAGKDNVYDKIKNMFTSFVLSYSSQEKKEFDRIVGECAKNNFKTFMENFIPSFGVDFFNRILKFNEIQKIHMLYYNLKYSLAETILYYIGLVSINKGTYLPVDIKARLYTLNNLDIVIKNKNDFIISTLNDKLDGYFEETKNYIVNKYINDMITNEEFDLKYTKKLKEIIKGIISGNIYNYENIYINLMRENIKVPFISEYTKVLNSATDDMKYFVENSKIEMKVELDSIFSTDSDSVLVDIQKKLNNTYNAVEKYNQHFETFKVSKEVIDFLDSFADDKMVPKYLQIKELLDKKTAELVLINLDKYSNEYRKKYSVQNFQNEVNKMNNNLTSYFDKFTNILKKYGSIEDAYKQNLEKEIVNHRRLRIRLLEETENRQNKKINGVKLNNTFNDLKNSSLLLKQSIQSLDLFTFFEDYLKKNISEINNQYLSTKYNLDKNKNNNENYDLMIERLEELNELSLSYYAQTQNIYDIMKDEIINNIKKIDELIYACEKVTFSIIYDKYLEIKNNFNKIEEIKRLEKEKINISPYKYYQTDNYFTVETTFGNILIDNKFTLDIIFEGESKIPKVVGKIINNVKPKVFSINFYSSTGQNGKLGRKIDVTFNNISSFTNIDFDAGLNQGYILTNFNFEEYSVKTQYYEEKLEYVPKNIMGMVIIVPGVQTKIDIETPEEEKYKVINSKNKTIAEIYSY